MPRKKNKRQPAPARNAAVQMGAYKMLGRMTAGHDLAGPANRKLIEDIRAAAQKCMALNGQPPEGLEEAEKFFEDQLAASREFAALAEQAPPAVLEFLGLDIEDVRKCHRKIEETHGEVIRTNRDVAQANAELNEILYNPETGAVVVAEQAKEHIRQTFGEDSEEYKQVKDLEFTVPEEFKKKEGL